MLIPDKVKVIKLPKYMLNKPVCSQNGLVSKQLSSLTIRCHEGSTTVVLVY